MALTRCSTRLVVIDRQRSTNRLRNARDLDRIIDRLFKLRKYKIQIFTYVYSFIYRGMYIEEEVEEREEGGDLKKYVKNPVLPEVGQSSTPSPSVQLRVHVIELYVVIRNLRDSLCACSTLIYSLSSHIYVYRKVSQAVNIISELSDHSENPVFSHP